MPALAHQQPVVGGADPGADFLGAASLAAMALRPGRGYRRDDVEEMRRRASNTVAHLEAEVETLRVQVGAMRSRLEADLGPGALARGAAWLARELRELFADREAERTWAGQELATIVSAASDDLSAELAEAFPGRVADLARGASASGRPAAWLVEAILGRDK